MSRKTKSTGDVIEFPGQEPFRPPDLKLMAEIETQISVDGFRIVLSQPSEHEEYDQVISISVHQARRIIKLLPDVIQWCESNQAEYSH